MRINPKNLYEASLVSADPDVPNIQAVVFIHSAGNEINFEYLALDKKSKYPLMFFKVSFNKKIEREDLGLYINFLIKTVNFENILKGNPMIPAETRSVFIVGVN
jgi:hypothetical protein